MLGSVGLAGWVVLREVGPWARSMRDIHRIEREGAVYYRSNIENSRRYGLLSDAYYAYRRRELPRALQYLRTGQADSPANALFDYVEAAVHLDSGDRAAALTAIRRGNSKPGVRLYAGQEDRPERWQWPQFDLARYAGKRIAADPAATREELVDVLKMGQKMLYSHPPDIVRLLQALEVRQAAAERLAEIARQNGRFEQAAAFESLNAEGQQFRRMIRRRLDQAKLFDRDSRAVIIGRSIRSNSERFRNAAMLLHLEEQARRAEEVRERLIRRDALEGLENW